MSRPIGAELEQYFLQTHNSKNSENSVGGLNPSNPSLGTPVNYINRLGVCCNDMFQNSERKALQQGLP